MAIGKIKGSEMTGWLMARANVTGWFTRLVFVLITLLLPLSSAAQSVNAVPISGGPVVTPFNTPAVNAPVRVCLISSFGSPCSTAGVTLYSDDNLTIPINNPAATNSQGVYTFFVNATQFSSPPLLVIQVSVTQTITYTYYFSAISPFGTPSCTLNQLLYYPAAGNQTSCLVLGSNLGITGNVLNATGGGGGGLISGLSGAPVVYQGSSYGATTTQGGGGAGPNFITGIINDGNPSHTPDNGLVINNAIASGGKFVLPNAQQNSLGAIGYNTGILAGASYTDLGGSGYGPSPTATSYPGTLLEYEGSGIAVSNFYNGFTGVGFSLHDMDIWCTNGTGTTGVQLSGTTGNPGNFYDLKNLDIFNCAQPLVLNSQGNGNLDNIDVQGSSSTYTGFLIEYEGGHAPNSNTITRLHGTCLTGSDNPAIIVDCGFFQYSEGNGAANITIGDADGIGSPGIVQIGNFAAGEIATGITAEVLHNESTRGPIYTIDEFSTATVKYDSGGAQLGLYPQVVALHNSQVQIDLNTSVANFAAPILTSTVNTTGGTLGPGTYCLFWQPENTAATIPGTSTTVDWYTGISAATCNTIATGTTNSITITGPWIGNASVYRIYEGATSTQASALQINTTTSGISGVTSWTYTYTGSETPTTVAPNSNIPLFTAATGAVVCVTGGQSYSTAILNNYGYMGQDANGAYFWTLACAPEVALGSAPAVNSAADPSYQGKLLQVIPSPSTVNGATELLYAFCSWASSAESCVWKNLFNTSFPISETVSDTSGTAISVTQNGVGTSGAALMNLYMTSASALGYPLNLENLSTTASPAYFMRMVGPTCTEYFTTNETNLCNDLFVTTPNTATSGANYSSSRIHLQGSGWNGSASTGLGFDIFANVTGTGSSPTNVLTIGAEAGTGLTPVSSINASTLPLSVNALTLAGSGFGGTQCLEVVSGVVTGTGGGCAPPLVGTGTYTTATSDAFTVTGVTSSSHCAFSATNAGAAAATVVPYISNYATNTVTISHVATTASGGTISLICTAN